MAASGEIGECMSATMTGAPRVATAFRARASGPRDRPPSPASGSAEARREPRVALHELLGVVVVPRRAAGRAGGLRVAGREILAGSALVCLGGDLVRVLP